MSQLPQQTPLPVLLITDGKPGHASLSEAIVAAVERRREVRLTTLRVDRPAWLPPRVLSGLTNANASLTPRLLGLDLGKVEPPGLVVSAGGDTLAANVFAARRFGCANVFYGSLRAYR
ncbi:MAG: nucleoside-diphosphate sugar epimerase, partial [Hyphomicrobiaceae bacterium]|nr:nucleoside-diphosphate sugar epimerase [Hyphomicrobiaceae bacterium]